MITQCCECRKVRQGSRWVPAEEPFPPGERVSHGYCPPCAREAMHEVEVYYANLHRATTHATV